MWITRDPLEIGTTTQQRTLDKGQRPLVYRSTSEIGETSLKGTHFGAHSVPGLEIPLYMCMCVFESRERRREGGREGGGREGGREIK